jgi:DNA-binding LacI/PurR family transcriptional regulator
MNAICEEAFAWDYNIVVCLSTEEFPESLKRTLDNRKVDGVILSRTVENDGIVDMLRKRDIPFSTIGSLPPDAQGWATVEADHDHIGGCFAFTLSFLQGNQEKVALLGNDMRYIVNQSRYAGFLKAVTTLNYPADNIYMRTGLGKASDCAAAVRELLDLGVTLFLCMDDDICMHSLAALMHIGKKIPEDVQLASLFDSEKLDSSPIGISALRFDASELGKTACRELLRCLKDEAYDATPMLGYRIISRESTI